VLVSYQSAFKKAALKAISHNDLARVEDALKHYGAAVDRQLVRFQKELSSSVKNTSDEIDIIRNRARQNTASAMGMVERIRKEIVEIGDGSLSDSQKVQKIVQKRQEVERVVQQFVAYQGALLKTDTDKITNVGLNSKLGPQLLRVTGVTFAFSLGHDFAMLFGNLGSPLNWFSLAGHGAFFLAVRQKLHARRVSPYPHELGKWAGRIDSVSTRLGNLFTGLGYLTSSQIFPALMSLRHPSNFTKIFAWLRSAPNVIQAALGVGYSVRTRADKLSPGVDSAVIAANTGASGGLAAETVAGPIAKSAGPVLSEAWHWFTGLFRHGK
jgi:hypothetical protein